jgi:hypothetical protein
MAYSKSKKNAEKIRKRGTDKSCKRDSLIRKGRRTMEIMIDPPARSYIEKKSPEKTITLGVGRSNDATNECSIGVYPVVKIGVSPFAADNYNKIIFEGICVYYPAPLGNTFKKVTVKVEEGLFYKQLWALAG